MELPTENGLLAADGVVVRSLPTPRPGRRGAVAFVAEHLGHLAAAPAPDAETGAHLIHGGQRAADNALSSLNIEGYARDRAQVYPQPKRAVSGLSAYIRHGLLSLPQVWDAAAADDPDDLRAFRVGLLWQEYARHWYARLGHRSRRPVRRDVNPGARGDRRGWDPSMACMELTVEELIDEGWLPNQARVWLASQWSVRSGRSWQDGEEFFFRHLLDGNRAANRLGWQWVVGGASDRPHGFSRWQVERWAAGLCASCDLVLSCPIEQWPPITVEPECDGGPLDHDSDPDTTAGPAEVVWNADPDCVWVTAESLGTSDPAMAAYPDLPVVFVFDEPLLSTLRLDAKRLVFMVETLAELAERREVSLILGRPTEALADRSVAVTHAPVPGYRRRAATIGPAVEHPWPWLIRPHGGSVRSFATWRQGSTQAPRVQ